MFGGPVDRRDGRDLSGFVDINGAPEPPFRLRRQGVLERNQSFAVVEIGGSVLVFRALAIVSYEMSEVVDRVYRSEACISREHNLFDTATFVDKWNRDVGVIPKVVICGPDDNAVVVDIAESRSVPAQEPAEIGRLDAVILPGAVNIEHLYSAA